MTTTEEVIRLARKAADPRSEDPVLSRTVILSVDEMARLVDLVKAEENEASAKVLQDNADACGEESIMRHILESQILAIRARRKA